MALVKCNACKQKISKNAKQCPNCGEPQKRTSLLTTLLTWLVVGFIAIMIFSAVFLPPAGNSPVEPKQTTPNEQQNVPQSKVENSARDAVQKLFQGDQEPTAKDALWTSHDVFKVGVINDGSIRDGYAEYVCQVLYEYGFKGSKVWVQVIDIVQLTKKGDWTKIGEAHCQ